MSERIKVGDLVMVIRTCCAEINNRTHPIGIPVSVKELYTAKVRCPYCGFYDETCAMARFNEKLSSGCVKSPVAWLKKINPPALDESVETKREVTA